MQGTIQCIDKSIRTRDAFMNKDKAISYEYNHGNCARCTVGSQHVAAAYREISWNRLNDRDYLDLDSIGMARRRPTRATDSQSYNGKRRN